MILSQILSKIYGCYGEFKELKRLQFHLKTKPYIFLKRLFRIRQINIPFIYPVRGKGMHDNKVKHLRRQKFIIISYSFNIHYFYHK